VAPDYVLVHERDAEAFLDGARTALDRFYGATDDARQASESLARIIDDGAFRRLTAALDATVAAGARLVIGGQRAPEERYLAPTILADVDQNAPVMREEIFGPVLPVITYSDMGEALARVNAGGKPLALYIFSEDAAATRHLLRNTTAGGTIINHVLCHLANPDLPFGGVGESGQGSYHGYAGFRAFSHERAVLRMGRLGLGPLYYPPYGPRMRRIASLVSRWMEKR
jgi:aldehyde dehydrogenase (NAD+)